jgi:hypothetical protein
VVLGGDFAGQIIVSARTAGARRDRAGISLFLLDPTTPGVTRRGYATQDGLRAAEIVLDAVRLPAAALGPWCAACYVRAVPSSPPVTSSQENPDAWQAQPFDPASARPAGGASRGHPAPWRPLYAGNDLSGG